MKAKMKAKMKATNTPPLHALLRSSKNPIKVKVKRTLHLSSVKNNNKSESVKVKVKARVRVIMFHLSSVKTNSDVRTSNRSNASCHRTTDLI